jgi:FixJ family two-component response regulator
MIHRQERRSLFGFSVARHIDLEDAQTIVAAIKETPADRPIDLVLHTPAALCSRLCRSRAPLTSQELAVLRLLSAGAQLRQVAQELELAEETVCRHLKKRRASSAFATELKPSLRFCASSLFREGASRRRRVDQE